MQPVFKTERNPETARVVCELCETLPCVRQVFAREPFSGVVRLLPKFLCLFGRRFPPGAERGERSWVCGSGRLPHPPRCSTTARAPARRA